MTSNKNIQSSIFNTQQEKPPFQNDIQQQKILQLNRSQQPFDSSAMFTAAAMLWLQNGTNFSSLSTNTTQRLPMEIPNFFSPITQQFFSNKGKFVASKDSSALSFSESANRLRAEVQSNSANLIDYWDASGSSITSINPEHHSSSSDEASPQTRTSSSSKSIKIDHFYGNLYNIN